MFLKITNAFVDHFFDFDPDSMPMVYEMIGMACNRFQVEKRKVAGWSVVALFGKEE